jgi:hypothetical protein
MDRDELTALRDALAALLTWPDSVRAELARWLAAPPAPTKANGHDAAVAAVTPPSLAKPLTARPHPAKPRRTAPHRSNPSSAEKPGPRQGERDDDDDERRLLEAMQNRPSAGERALAKAIGRSRSSIGERLS